MIIFQILLKITNDRSFREKKKKLIIKYAVEDKLAEISKFGRTKNPELFKNFLK